MTRKRKEKEIIQRIQENRAALARLLKKIDINSPTTGSMLIDLLCDGACGEQIAARLSDILSDDLLDPVLKANIKQFVSKINLIETDLRQIHRVPFDFNSIQPVHLTGGKRGA